MTATLSDNRRRTTDIRRSSFIVHRSSLAFTLVEMLVVITIIGILASLATVAAYKALEAAKRARITAELANLDGAVKAYKEKFGDYPPCYYDSTIPASKTAVERHLAKCFPRCDVTNEITYVPNNLDPAQALVFWLTSISKNPQQPLSANVDTADRQSFFDFDRSRFTPVSGGFTKGATNPTFVAAQTYHPSGATAPYVYFEARGYLDPTVVAVPFKPKQYKVGTDTCMPLLWDTDGDGKFDDWCNPKSFQIISAGLDDKYGNSGIDIDAGASNPITANNAAITKITGKLYPTGKGYDTSGADDDDLTNFSDKQLGDAKP